MNEHQWRKRMNERRKLYFCIGCRQVHFDRDYSKEDGDLEIINKKRFLDSVDKINGEKK